MNGSKKERALNGVIDVFLDSGGLVPMARKWVISSESLDVGLILFQPVGNAHQPGFQLYRMNWKRSGRLC